MCFRGYDQSARFVQRADAKVVKTGFYSQLDVSPDEHRVFETTCGEHTIGIITCCQWGGPQAAMLVEDLCALGVRHIIGWGAAGGFCGVHKGAHALASESLALDGASRAYCSDLVLLPDSGLIERAMQTADALGIELNGMRMATTDAIYRETPDLVERWKQLGAKAVNMESSALYAAARCCGAKALWIGCISDCLGEEWDDWHETFPQGEEESVRLCLALARQVDAHERGS